MKTWKFIIQRHYLSIYFLTYICIIWNHIRAIQGGFHNLFLSLLFILVQGSIEKELIRKPDVVANTSKFKYILHNITIQMKSLQNPSQVLSSKTFKTSRKYKEKTRADPRWNITTIRAIQSCTLTRFYTIDPNIGLD